MSGQDVFVNMSFSQIMAIPVARPIFNREIANKMYSSSAYYLASVTASVVIFFLYPIVTSVVSFYFFGLDEHSFADLVTWTAIMTLVAFAGSFWGFMVGTISENEVTAAQINLFWIFTFSFGGGFYVNTGAN